MTSVEVDKCVTQWIKDRENQILILSTRLAEEKKEFEKASNAHSEAMYKNESSATVALFEKRFDVAFRRFRDTNDEIADNKLHPKWKELLEADYSYNEYFTNVFRDDDCQGLAILLDRMNHFIRVFTEYEEARKSEYYSPRKTKNFKYHFDNVENYLKTLNALNLYQDDHAGLTDQARSALDIKDRLEAIIEVVNNGNENKRVFFHSDNFNTEKVDVPTRTYAINDTLNNIFATLVKHDIEVHKKNLEKVIRRFFEIYQ